MDNVYRSFRGFLGSTVDKIRHAYSKKNHITRVVLPTQFYNYVNDPEFLNVLKIHKDRCQKGKWDTTLNNTVDVQLVVNNGVYYIEYSHAYKTKRQARREYAQEMKTAMERDEARRKELGLNGKPRSSVCTPYGSGEIYSSPNNTGLFALLGVSFM